jgi:hypothetical protein
MNRITATWATAAALVSLTFAVLAGCNSAQFMSAPPEDAGIVCSTIAPIFSGCDAGAALPNACVAAPTSSDSVVARIPAGDYPVGCAVQFYFDDYGGGCAPAPVPCTCLPGDAGADGSPAQWSNCLDAGLQGP